MNRRLSLKIALLAIMAYSITLLSSCSTPSQQINDSAPKKNVDISRIANATPKNEPKSRYGNPTSYIVLGKRYYVLPSSDHYSKKGIASWYGTKFHGRLTSTREPYDMYAMTAASPELPIPCYAQVTNLNNGKSIIVKVNDRGPFAPNRIIDLSYVAAKKLDMIKNGTALVRVDTITSPPPLFASAPPAQKPSSAPPSLYLQVGAFHDYSNALSLKKKLSKITPQSVRIEKNTSTQASLYLVQIGPISNVQESDQLHIQLSQQGFNDTLTIIS